MIWVGLSLMCQESCWIVEAFAEEKRTESVEDIDGPWQKHPESDGCQDVLWTDLEDYQVMSQYPFQNCFEPWNPRSSQIYLTKYR